MGIYRNNYRGIFHKTIIENLRNNDDIIILIYILHIYLNIYCDRMSKAVALNIFLKPKHFWVIIGSYPE